MHDFILAKEIIDELKKITVEKDIAQVKRVNLEIGQVALAHDGHEEHVEDIALENLEFGLKSNSRNTPLENTKFDIKKIDGHHWRIVEIEI